MTSPQIIFGSPEFCTKVHDANEHAFRAFSELADLANEIFVAADGKTAQDFEKAIYLLTRLTFFGLNDVIVLATNGSGTGAMKIVRSMFESSALAEYLRLYPHDAKDYIDFGRVISWRRYQWLLGNVPSAAGQYPPDKVQSIEDEYNRVKPRFANDKGKVRAQWTSKPIGEIASAIGRSQQYELIYSVCSSLHHANYEGLSGYAEVKDGDLAFDGPPSMAWTSEALRCAHSYSVLTLNTLNESCHLGFEEKMNAAGKQFICVWKK
jgi:hypothetical protein